MAVIGWVDSGLRLSREPQEGKAMSDTTDAGRGSRPWEQGKMSMELRRVFMDGVHWVSLMQTHEDLCADIHEDMCREARRRYPDAEPQNRRGTGTIVSVEERPPMIVEDNGRVKPEWMHVLEEQTDRGYPPELKARREILLASACGAALAEIKAQEKEIACLAALTAGLNEQNVSLAEEIARFKAEVSYERERNANNVACAETERDALRRQLEAESIANEQECTEHEPERILPSGKELWEKKLGSGAGSFPELSAKKQQVTVEAICRWLCDTPLEYRTEGEHERLEYFMSRIIVRLRGDAARVVQEARGEE